MSSDPKCIYLRSHCFSEDGQMHFASLSGDFNPMHVDPVAARRTLAGGIAVHGINLALTSLEALLAWFASQNQPSRSITAFKAQFLNSVVVGDKVGIEITELTDETCRLAAKVKDQVACKVTFRLGAPTSSVNVEMPSLAPQELTELSFAELKDKSGTVTRGLDAALAHQLFPLTTAMLGNLQMAETLALSRLVGMHCPGLHSMFGQADIRYEVGNAGGELNYRVKKTDDRFGRVIMSVVGHHLQGELLVYYRPPPVPQAEMAAVAAVVKPGSFSDSIALIVGGSRGLGEITAKIIAAGGGLPFITYLQGRQDAEKVVQGIRVQKGRCEVLQLDVRDSGLALEQLRAARVVPRSLYYFATPKIFGRRHSFFNHDMLAEFDEIYVSAFGRLIDGLAEMCPEKLRVFYPSSVAVTEGLREMTEYAMAKRLAEEMCSFYNTYSKKVEIVVERLPRIMTDQTSTLTSFPAETALEVILPLVRRTEHLGVA